MKTTQELISDELRSIRAKKNINIETVAEKCGINKDTIYRYEKNKTSMKLDTIEKLLKFYDIDFSIFFTNIYANKHNS